MLEHHGIRTMLRDASPLAGRAVKLMSAPELLVRRADAERARDILGNNDQGIVPDAKSPLA